VHWRQTLEGADREGVQALIDAARSEDDEAGFSTVTAEEFDNVGLTHAAHLVVRLVPRSSGQSEGLARHVEDDELPLVAYLRLEVTGDRGEVGYLVHPAYRSLGISTLLFEQLGLDFHGPSGWQDTGARSLVVWAHGAHPATERMSRRFGARPVRRLWRLTRPFHGELASELPPAPGPQGRSRVRPMTDADLAAVRGLADRCRDQDHVIGRWTVIDVRAFEATSTIEPAHTLVADMEGRPIAALVLSATPGRDGRQRRTLPFRLLLAGDDVDPAVVEDLFVAGLHALDGRGAWAATAYVDSEDADVAKAALTASLEHEQSDVCYEIH
jgi:mycothiol synthase